MMLTLDTDASFVLTLFKANFVDYVECGIPIKNVTKFNNVIGIRTTTHKISNGKVDYVYLLRLCTIYQSQTLVYLVHRLNFK